VIRVDTVQELFDVGLLLAHQPLPAGRRVAVVGNSSALSELAVAACRANGLTVAAGYPLDISPQAGAHDFADALALIPQLEHDYAANPVGVLATLYLDRWHLDGRALLVGDAAHAIVPFHGQGMNCGFEDAVELAALLAEHHDDLAWTFAEFERRRRPNAEAIAAMALENYVEMRDAVADPDFLLRRELGRLLAERHPDRFMPRYSMVTFTRMPYMQAFARGTIQDQLLRELTAGCEGLADVDLAVADALVLERLTPLR
jgi:kynurenine 3-monooxygenase